MLLILLAQIISVEKLHRHLIITKILEYNNQVRQKEGLYCHILSPELIKAAQSHASYMAYKHDKQDEEFEHKGRNGSPGSRAGDHGYSGVVYENIARGYKNINEVFVAWENSIDHWATIKSNTIDAGFGYAVSKDGTIYWVAVYGSKSHDNRFMLISDVKCEQGSKHVSETENQN